MTHNRLSIGLNGCKVDVEGDAAFVRAVYEDFKEKVFTNVDLKGPSIPSQSKPNSAKQDDERSSAKNERRAPSSKKKSFKPKVDSHLKLEGLAEFYKGFKCKNNQEKILVFLKFLQDLGQEKPHLDAVYTCYKFTEQSVPNTLQQIVTNMAGKLEVEFSQKNNLASIEFKSENRLDKLRIKAT